MFDFEDIKGNTGLVNNLRSAIENKRVNHAYIFDGAAGSGKLMLAKTFAKTLNCVEGGSKPCNKCKSCISFDSDNNPDIIYVREDDGKNIKVDTVREKINREINIKPYSYKYKIFIIEHGDTMNVQAQNAFLKTLEEPPEYGIFLITCRNYNKFLVTILSRCILFRMKPLTPMEIQHYLISRLGVDNAEAEVLAHYGQGSIGRAVELNNSEEFKAMADKALETAVSLDELDLINMYKTTDALKEYNGDIDLFLELLYMTFRDALLINTIGNNDRVIQKNHLKELTQIADMGQKRLIRCCDSINYARNRLNLKGDFQFTIEELFFNLKEKDR